MYRPEAVLSVDAVAIPFWGKKAADLRSTKHRIFSDSAELLMPTGQSLDSAFPKGGASVSAMLV